MHRILGKESDETDKRSFGLFCRRHLTSHSHTVNPVNTVQSTCNLLYDFDEVRRLVANRTRLLSALSLQKILQKFRNKSAQGILFMMSLMISHGGYVKVFTDGACSSNGKSGAQAGFGVFWGEDHPWNVCAPVTGGRATNNSGEIQAATCALQQAHESGIRKLEINTDSRFLIDAVTKWMPGWKQNGWRLASGQPVKNQRDFKQLDYAMRFVQVRWHFVPAHQGIYGNEMADQLARQGAMMYGG